MQFAPRSEQTRCSVGIVQPGSAQPRESEHFDSLDDPSHASPLPEEHRIKVGAVDLRVAQSACLIFGRLVVEGGRARRRPIHIRCMTTEAKEIDVVDLQQARIGRSVRHVAGKTAFIRFHRSVFEDKRSHGVGVALGADRELTGGSSHLVTCLGAMRIVAVAALDKSNIDTMPVRPGKLRLLRGVAAIAQLSLRFRQHEIDICRTMGTVTGGATDAIGQVFRVGKVLRLQAGLMAFRADRSGLGRA